MRAWVLHTGRSTSRATRTTSSGIRPSRPWSPSAPATRSSSTASTPRYGQLTAASASADLATLDFDRVDQVTGPVAVDGAEPGDTLQVDLLEFEPADWGWTANIPGFGLLADEFPDPASVTRLAAGRGRVEFLPGIRIPLAPFCGEIGVAPPTGPLSTIPPDVHGGNMDTRHLTAGATLFLPVFQRRRALLIGDGHAAQGDGEVCGTAIETPMRATSG